MTTAPGGAPPLLTGAPLLLQQYKALLKKNAILTWRNRRSATVQILSSFFFILLIFLIDKAIRARYSIDSDLDPDPVFNSPIPPCEEKYFIRKPCFDFAWSGKSSPRIRSIVQRIMLNNPGRPIPTEKVKAFGTAEEVDEWLGRYPMTCPGALHFVDRGEKVISYGVQTNSTSVQRRGDTEDPTFKFQVPLMLAAEREIGRVLLGDPNFSWVVGLKEFAHPATSDFNAVAQAGPTFFLAIAMFGFVFQISSLVAEKELKLRQAMSMMGLYDTAYWLSWLTWESLLTLVAALITVLFGMMFQFDFFLQNSFAILFLVFFLFQLNMLSFAFMISTFISKSTSATNAGFSLFIVGFVTQTVTAFGFPYSGSYADYKRILWSFFPPNLFAQAIKILGDATSTPDEPGISWSMRGECISDSDSDSCVITIETIFKWLISTFFLWILLAMYFDNIIPNSSGVRKPILYFLMPSYWTGYGGSMGEESSPCSCLGSAPPLDDAPPDDEDVLAEETVVRQTQNERDPNIAAQIHGLQKSYPGALNIGCCKCRRTKPFHAVKGIWLNLAKDQLFCLLGPNGAGKTTTISCLTGLTPITGGDALIYGNSVRSSVGMSNIRKIIGVCPQFDILWDALTAEEHLHLFAGIKGLLPSTIKLVSAKSLADGKLTNAARVRAGSYSGGMKRRLSVAIALMGDPKLVFLDEPTTGMDPITRRHVWDIIEDAKKGRAIVLTTHSMEEADILGDRIAVMAKGKLRCIGTSIRLKSKFGAGYVATVSFTTNRQTNNTPVELVKQFFKNHLNIDPKEETKTFMTFVIPHEKEPLLTNFFSELQDRENEFGISDIQLGLTTLEEVFLNIAKQAELENSASEGTLVTLDLSSGVAIQVPKGASFIGIPGTESDENPRGLMVEVFWQQDDSGSLGITGHSPETPIPSHIQMAVPAVDTRTERGRVSPAIGFVIDPRQISDHQ